MAITNAQQYQQLVNKPANGKRPGYRGPGGYQGGASSRSGPPGGGATAGGSGRDFSGGGGRDTGPSQGPAGGASAGGNYGGNRNPNQTYGGSIFTGGGGQTTTPTTPVKKPIKKPKKTKDNFKKPNIIQNYFENSLFTKGLQALKNSRLAQLNSQKQREDYLNNLQITNPELYQETIDDLEKLGYYNPDPVEYYGPESKGAARDIEQFPDLYEDQAKSILNTVRDNFDDEGTATVGTLYDDYLDSRNTPTGGGGGDDQVIDPCKGPNPPAYCFVDDKKEEEVNPRDYTGLAPRFMGSSFDFTGLAEGGRVAAQQGGIMSQQGGIMPRLSDLSGDVSSAEQMLQEINQRLESAESTLGEGGNMRGTTIAPNMSPLENAMRSQQPLGPYDQLRQIPIGQPGLASIANYTPFGGETFNQVPEQFRTGFDEYKKENPIGIGGQAISYSMLPDGNRVSFGDTASASGFSNFLNSIGQGVSPVGQATAIQSPLASSMRQGAMDGGRMRQMEMMEDEDDPTGGIMDLESGRQMYFLGKLVKKAGRAIKKVVKSPIGKAALMYFGGQALMGAGGGKGLSSFFGKGSFNPLKALITKGPQTGMLGSSGLGKIFGNLGLAKEGALTLGGKLGLGFGVPFALDALGVGKEEDDGMDLDEYYKTQGIDIDAIRNNPNRILARRFMAEGGDAEPVAKKTMPLLDMDGMEKDYREDGGFVPIGRMERADDVPARLSKNEFVFTADAVRNAGEGDIDKGAEVMYNMMKNLESGGEVSEESQGLDGAKEMFQTSQRLEEVL